MIMLPNSHYLTKTLLFKRLEVERVNIIFCRICKWLLYCFPIPPVLSVYVVVSMALLQKGLIRHEEDAMFIQPLPDHLAKHFRTKADTHPHLIHKADILSGMKIDDTEDEHTCKSIWLFK